MISSNQHTRLIVRYRVGDGDWSDLSLRQTNADASSVQFASQSPTAPLKATETFRVNGKALDWDIQLESATNVPVEVGDLGVQIPVTGPRGEEPKQIFERGFLRHQFIEGSGSYLFFVRASGTPPFLMVTDKPGTKLESFHRGRRRARRIGRLYPFTPRPPVWLPPKNAGRGASRILR